MTRILRNQAFGMLLATLGRGATARATDGPSEFVFVVPFVGVEYVGIASAALHPDVLGVNTTRSSGAGVAFGGHAGVALGNFHLGALYQQSRITQSDGLNFNKLYLEAGFAGRAGIVGLTVSLAGGWAFFSADGVSRRDGGGARVGFATDFYLLRYLSVGPEIAVDAGGYVSGTSVYASWGLTVALRVGLHL